MRLLAACLLAARARAECDFKDDIQALIEGDASKAGEEQSPSSMQQYRMLSAMRTSQLQERLHEELLRGANGQQVRETPKQRGEASDGDTAARAR